MNTMVNNIDDDMVMINIVNAHAEEVKRNREMNEMFFGNAKREQMVGQKNYRKAMSFSYKKVMNFFLNILLVLSILFLAWIILSWVNVVSHNLQPGGYEMMWGWNFFKVFFGH